MATNVFSTAPTMFNPAQFGPMIRPFVGAFNNASMTEAAGIDDLRRERAARTAAMLGQAGLTDVQRMGQMAALPYIAPNLEQNYAKVGQDMSIAESMRGPTMAHLNAQTQGLNTQAGLAPLLAGAQLSHANTLAQSQANDQLKMLLELIGPMGPVMAPETKAALTQHLLQRLGIAMPAMDSSGTGQAGPITAPTGQPQVQGAGPLRAFANAAVPVGAAAGTSVGLNALMAALQKTPHGATKLLGYLLPILAGYGASSAMGTGSPEGMATARENPKASAMGGLLGLSPFLAKVKSQGPLIGAPAVPPVQPTTGPIRVQPGPQMGMNTPAMPAQPFGPTSLPVTPQTTQAQAAIEKIILGQQGANKIKLGQTSAERLITKKGLPIGTQGIFRPDVLDLTQPGVESLLRNPELLKRLLQQVGTPPSNVGMPLPPGTRWQPGM